MKIVDAKVKMRDFDGEFDFKMPVMESLQEAVDRYGERVIFKLVQATLKAKLQNKARNLFRAGKGLEEVNKIVAEFVPGGDPNRGLKTKAMDLLTAKGKQVRCDPDLKLAALEAYSRGDYMCVVEMLQDL